MNLSALRVKTFLYAKGMALSILSSCNRKKYYSDLPPDFLIIGLMKSGTYWLTNLLDNHPEINAFPTVAEGRGKNDLREGKLFNWIAHPEYFESWIRKRSSFFSDLLIKRIILPKDRFLLLTIRRYNAYVALQRHKKIVGEKTPDYVLYLDIVKKFYPGIKKICIIRDPRDRVVSLHFHRLRKKQSGEVRITDREVLSFCDTVKKEYAELIKYRENSLYAMTYEDLHNDPMRSIKSLLEWLGCSSDESIIKSMFEKASFVNLKKRNVAESSLSHYRKGVVRDWINHLQPDQSKSLVETLREATLELSRTFHLDLNGYNKE
jgi:hypothetical protein